MLALFLEKVLLAMEEVKPLLSNDHFSVDGTLLQGWVHPMPPSRMSMASKPRGRLRALPLPDLAGRAQGFGKLTHRSSSDPDARLARRRRSIPPYRPTGVICAYGQSPPPGGGLPGNAN